MSDQEGPLHGILVQPQPALGRIAVAIMQGPLMVGAVVYDSPDALKETVGQLVQALQLVFPDALAQPQQDLSGHQAGPMRSWACKLGDDCTCPLPRHPDDIPSLCSNFQGPKS